MADFANVQGAQTAQSISTEALRAALTTALEGKDLAAISLTDVRKQMAQNMGFELDAFVVRKKEIKQLATQYVKARNRGSEAQSLLQQLLGVPEKGDASQRLYLATISRVIGATLPDGRAYKDLGTATRKAIAEAVAAAFNDPLSHAARGGRPRQAGEERVSLIVVFLEYHGDGSVHFHVVVKLVQNTRFQAAKRTLRERELLPSHFSSEHTQLWSAIRYGYIATPVKPDVDETPWIWTPEWSGFENAEGCPVDLFELAQEPFQAAAWTKRRELKDKESAKTGAKSSFGLLDLKSLIMAKHLYSKDCLLAYIQDHGTAAMQVFASKNQRKLTEYIEDAEEWAGAKTNAAFETTSDWDLIRKAYETPCPHGDACTYHKAVTEIFKKNANTVCKARLAYSLRNIIQQGPSKHVRVPLLKGPSNSGKSTILYPLDDIFTPKKVSHKPALGSRFGLVNLDKKRLIFWDDYSPVEFAHEKTVTKSTFLSLFIGKHCEIQAPQNTHNGNPDITWNRCVVFTAKADGLWNPTKVITEEDIKHLRNRCDEFPFHHVFERDAVQEVTPCAHHFAKWVVEEAANYEACLVVANDADETMPPSLPLRPTPTSAGDGEVESVKGFKRLMEAASIPQDVQELLLADLEDLGAAAVAELAVDDWQGLPSWMRLKTLQRRRLLQQAVGPRSA